MVIINTKEHNYIHKGSEVYNLKEDNVGSTPRKIYMSLVYGSTIIPLVFAYLHGISWVHVSLFIILILFSAIITKLETREKSEMSGRIEDRLPNYSGSNTLDYLNNIVLVGESKEYNKVGQVRRLYTVLETNSEGILSVNDNIRVLKDSEYYKEELCMDVKLTDKEWDKLRMAFLKISDDLSLKERLNISFKQIENDKIELEKELKDKDTFITQYIKENGKDTLPLSIEGSRNELSKELHQLENNLGEIKKEIENMGFKI